MFKLFSKIYLGWWFIVFVVLFTCLYPFFLVLLCHPTLYKAANILRRIWALMHCLCIGVWPIIRRAGTPVPQPAIYCANHFSYMDIVMMSLICKGNYCFMAKTELNHIPLFGIFFQTVDISVNRKHRGDAVESLNEAARRFQLGYSIIIFPEGTICGLAPQMGAFKNGPFRLAHKLKAPIIPVSLLNNFKRMDIDTGFGGSPGLARAIVHPALNVLGDVDAETLKMRTLALIQTDLDHLYGHHA